MTIQESLTTFAGLANENEFFSPHYLAEVFQSDLADTIRAWEAREQQDREQAERDRVQDAATFISPHRALRNLHRDYFEIRFELSSERDIHTRIEHRRSFFRRLMNLLDIPWQPENRLIAPNIELPVLSALGHDLWVLGAFDVAGEGEDPLALTLHPEQFIGDGPHFDALKGQTWEDILHQQVFRQEQPPRWVLLLSAYQGLLIDRYKWSQSRMLRFDWEEILGRRDDRTLKATAVLLHRQSLVPDEGQSRLDTLDENSHRHAFSVSDDLKYALRASIELLGNEAAEQLIARAAEQKKGIYSGAHALDAEALSRECLRYMYRLLFLFYIEARPELGYLPVADETWRDGYSLESLRDLELIPLNTEASRQGSFIHQSLQRMFTLIHEGYGADDEGGQQPTRQQGARAGFAIRRIDSHLFDPKRTPLLNSVTFSNATLQEVIRSMSLNRPTRSNRRRGRVSYSQLGINQLGAVYEALLSYRGFFASEDLYEVTSAKKNINPDDLETGYFVTAAQLENFDEQTEWVYDLDDEGRKKLRLHPKGKFTYRMAGRDREKTASYYTPEVLTRSLVRYTLKERLHDDLSADDILELTICEPAMGSAAFLNEAVNQLAQEYLARKEKERGERIPHDSYLRELQRVKHHIVDHNVFGVDLNPIAIELAEVSLWLNALSADGQIGRAHV